MTAPLNLATHGVQLAIFFLAVVVIIVFMKITTLEHRIKVLEEHEQYFVSHEAYMESFNNMFDAKMQGKNLSAFT